MAYQRVLHQLVRREWRLLGELATWAPAGEAERTATLTRHADLIGRVLLHHHAVERESVWPALLRAVPADRADAVRAALADWTDRCARIDHMLRDVSTAARQWQVAGTAPARDAFALACLDLADAVDAQTAEEEAVLLPLLGRAPRRRRLGRDRPLVALPALRPRAAAGAGPGARGRLRRRPGATDQRALPGDPHGLADARPQPLPGGRRPAPGRSAGAVTRSQ